MWSEFEQDFDCVREVCLARYSLARTRILQYELLFVVDEEPYELISTTDPADDGFVFLDISDVLDDMQLDHERIAAGMILRRVAQEEDTGSNTVSKKQQFAAPWVQNLNVDVKNTSITEDAAKLFPKLRAL